MASDEAGNITAIKIPETNNTIFLRNSVWSIQHRDKADSRKPLLVSDHLIFKSTQGFYLKLDEYGVLKADSNQLSDKSYWHVCKAKIPFVPNWARVKPFLTSAYLTPSLNEARIVSASEEQQLTKRSRDP
jgi:hypothetical protein